MINVRLLLLLVGAGLAALLYWLPKPAEPALPVAASGLNADVWKVNEPHFVSPNSTIPPRPVSLPNDLWGQIVSAPSLPGASNEPKSWRLVGVGIQPKEPFVLISFDGKDPEMRKLGEALPGGATVAAVAQDHICVFIDGDKSRRRKLPIAG